MVEVAGDLQLPPETVECRHIAHDRLVRALEDDWLPIGILGQIDLAEGPLADRPYDRELVEL